ncbi:MULTISPECIES: hypothetical protein [unclassified Clostridium]|uniref:hypothetical protein n=1 Tax=unclassified Clostridium TaxID=2614128 RepID=UPI00029838B1|nr:MULTISPECIES: hypothetical protein [unclassified Clostridium]EKQ53800.1 MAG: hypothetical protein A370_03546 [Clostridium sp. Maddingley MBC34-26]
MKKKKLMISVSILCIILSFSLIGCSIKDDYIIETKENTDEKPSSDKINEAFDSEKVKDLMDKLKTTPKELSDKSNDVDSDTVRTMRELNDKADELTDALNSADFQGKSEDIKNKFDDINDKLNQIKDNVEDAKNRVDTAKNPIDEKQVTNTVDEFQVHMNNLQRALDRAASTR